MVLALPSQPSDTVKLADWLELSALTSPDRTASRGDLEGALVSGSVFDGKAPEVLESALLNVFQELERRSLFAEAYPFDLEQGLLTAPEVWLDKSSYVFCLCLSYFGWANVKGTRTKPRRIFEVLSAEAVRQFIGGNVYRFGSPRVPPVESDFRKAINELCGLLKEGGPFTGEPLLNRKDDGVDLVAWRNEVDQLSGKLLLFGGCASGQDWDQKLSELMPTEFCETWMQRVPVSRALKAFFIPHRIDLSFWDYAARRAGLIFDRCRICKLAPILPDGGRFGDGLEWTTGILRGLST